MPTRPPSPCLEPMCEAYAVWKGRCEEHRAEPWGGSTRDTTTSKWHTLRLRILRRDRWTCYRCGGVAKVVDHITPLAEGGTDAEDNLGALCTECDRSKSSAEGNRARKRRKRRPTTL